MGVPTLTLTLCPMKLTNRGPVQSDEVNRVSGGSPPGGIVDHFSGCASHSHELQ